MSRRVSSVSYSRPIRAASLVVRYSEACSIGCPRHTCSLVRDLSITRRVDETIAVAAR